MPYKIRKNRAVLYGGMIAIAIMLIVIGLLTYWSKRPIVLGTECRTAGGNGDHLLLGKRDCNTYAHGDR